MREGRPSIALPTPVERRWQALRRLQALVDDAVERALHQEHGLSVSEYLALASLAYSDDGGHLRQQVLADAIPLKHSSVSRLVGRLEREGLTERYLCETDRRGVYTQITEHGRDLLARARETYLRTLETELAAARHDPELVDFVDLVRAQPPT
ncbi:MarR family winged helix-turn-helix transcriptional regulator [Actinoalloteichus spitiensis]|uniref:MarR family winged helix-turn-helix transcriptional regulator n=1 Tax=Actinoalloteichus spitiensis TaxID=252394 RepID=UPI0003149E9D|nr:MarR family transcriptional regulator [Actinoalloteichus spitiensis]